ncbi:MAG: hypothetical protein KF787_09740 [Phycisphaeraceae bacterium]|nr:hypothetical protein [Phycisphaerae bacterium]MBX3392914.1 hypothetical protein [Phycisphaeraceae bacterium]
MTTSLKEDGSAGCFGCGYSLDRGSRRCPECGLLARWSCRLVGQGTPAPVRRRIASLATALLAILIVPCVFHVTCMLLTDGRPPSLASRVLAVSLGLALGGYAVCLGVISRDRGRPLLARLPAADMAALRVLRVWTPLAVIVLAVEVSTPLLHASPSAWRAGMILVLAGLAAAQSVAARWVIAAQQRLRPDRAGRPSFFWIIWPLAAITLMLPLTASMLSDGGMSGASHRWTMHAISASFVAVLYATLRQTLLTRSILRSPRSTPTVSGHGQLCDSHTHGRYRRIPAPHVADPYDALTRP